ncbi:hypothetical protein TREES_T100018440 [Tupaia chinensis]|uniref:Uncharacterized protein n=1 Tax=Tupaia chinensis TaxID=246437 RepID=L9L2N6_TUPCH|nr:hypothetical protein TREES_T100018440 [Tupaia chinensis]
MSPRIPFVTVLGPPGQWLDSEELRAATLTPCGNFWITGMLLFQTVSGSAPRLQPPYAGALNPEKLEAEALTAAKEASAGPPRGAVGACSADTDGEEDIGITVQHLQRGPAVHLGEAGVPIQWPTRLLMELSRAALAFGQAFSTEQETQGEAILTESCKWPMYSCRYELIAYRTPGAEDPVRGSPAPSTRVLRRACLLSAL